MRSTRTNIRGAIALIRQGSGLVVGTAELADCLPPLNRTSYMDHCDRHGIPPVMLDEVLANGWVVPWVIENARAVDPPIPYKHKSGAVLFVNLEESVADAIRRQQGTVFAGASGDSYRQYAAAANPRAAAIGNITAKSAITAQQPSAGCSPAIASSDQPLFVFRPQVAQAYGCPKAGGAFVVLKDSTAMRNGSPAVKRDRLLRDQLVRSGVLVPDMDRRLYRFAADYPFANPSAAAGVIKDGNASGPQLWKDEKSGRSLRDYLAGSHS